jgi:hypothetical protein
MFSKLLLTSVATVGLLLAGPKKASAQTISVCINSATGLLYVVAANANCPPASGNVTWTKTTLSQTPGTPGAIAARQYNCSPLPQTVTTGADVTFVDIGIGFGTTLPTPVGTFSSFLLQPGFYQAHLSAGLLLLGPNSYLSFDPFLSATWPLQGEIVSGDRLFSVTTANTSAKLLLGGPNAITFSGPCLLILTQLQ